MMLPSSENSIRAMRVSSLMRTSHVAVQMCNQRHTQRPAELNSLYVITYDFLVFREESVQPLANRLVAGICLEEPNFQGWLSHVDLRTNLIRLSKPFICLASACASA